ncbi:FAD-dependent oxidoreductase [Paracoccus sp. S-4012]|uniref:NAD(P)/FAD-dependent oxidoreductase n=1 Tax=Paracoccus sp. S-4012 TaxID=2665648 RepID=UPI00132A7C78|nr:FAD-dependent oxidoreductase [Paracoccus sp. S-4012]
MTDQPWDAAIIGGGLVGVATAFYLSQRGARVLVLDRQELNRAASGQNAGSLHFQIEQRLVSHGEAMTRQAATILPLIRDAITRWGGITEALGETDLDVVQHGGLMVAENAEQIALLESKLALEGEGGLPTRIIDGDELRSMAPYLGPKVIAATHCPVEGHGNPRLITAALARAALRARAEIRTWSPVTGLRRDGGVWRIESGPAGDGGARIDRARTVVNAAGAWSREVAALAGLHLPVFPVALSMNATDAAVPFIPLLIQHVGRRLSLKQMREGNLLIGGGWSARFERAEGAFDTLRPPAPRLESIRGNLAAALTVVPALAQRTLLRSWTGIVGVTADQLPLLGEMPEAPGFFVATGGSAFTLGLTYAALLAEMIDAGRTSMDVSIYAPDRFGHINMFMGA